MTHQDILIIIDIYTGVRGDIITYTTGAIITRSYNNNEEEEEEAKHD